MCAKSQRNLVRMFSLFMTFYVGGIWSWCAKSATVFQALVEASSKRLVSLANQWEKHRLPLLDEYRSLKELSEGQMVRTLILLLQSVFHCRLFLAADLLLCNTRSSGRPVLYFAMQHSNFTMVGPSLWRRLPCKVCFLSFLCLCFPATEDHCILSWSCIITLGTALSSFCIEVLC